MICRLVIAVLLAVSAISSGAVDFQYGPRPPIPVFDPSGILTPASVKEIARPLEAAYKTEGIDVIVVVLPEIGGKPPEQVAGNFAQAWCKESLRCVVLAVPGQPGSPWICPSGKLVNQIKPDDLELALAAAKRRSAAEPLEPAKIKTAANDAADLMRFWLTNAVNRTETLLTESVRHRLENETRRRHWKIAALTFAASCVPLGIGIMLLLNYFRRRSPVYFPQVPPRFRLGAPHAGGNHAVVDIGKLPL